jgi:hypothetical protein
MAENDVEVFVSLLNRTHGAVEQYKQTPRENPYERLALLKEAKELARLLLETDAYWKAVATHAESCIRWWAAHPPSLLSDASLGRLVYPTLMLKW